MADNNDPFQASINPSYTNPAPQQTPQEGNTPTVDPFKAATNTAYQSSVETPAALPRATGSAANMAMRYSFAPVSGALKGAANILDFMSAGTELPGDIPFSVEQQGNDITRHTGVPTEIGKYAEDNLPKPKDQIESTLEGAGQGAIENAPFGPSAMLPGAISEGVTHWRNAASPDTPIKNAVIGMVAGLAPTNLLMKGAHVFGEGLGLAEKPAIVQARKDLGIPPNTAAGIGEDNSYPRAVRAFRESPFNDAIPVAEREAGQALENKMGEQADTLGQARSPEAAGTELQNAAQDWQHDTENPLSLRGLILNRQVDPQNTMVPVQGVLDKLDAAFTPPDGSFQMDKHAAGLLSELKQSVFEYGMQKQYGAYWKQYAQMGYTPNKTEIPLASIQYLKRNVNDDIKTGILNNQVTEARNNKIAGKALSDAESSAYAGTPYASDFKQLQSDWSSYFNNLQNNIQPYLAGVNGQDKTAGAAYTSLMSEKGKGGEKILNTLSLLPPEVKNNIAANELTKMGMGTDGSFNPDTFFKNWSNPKRGLSQEAKAALFGDQNGDIPAIYDKLALISQEQARSEAAKNFSGTGGTAYFLRTLGKFAKYGAIPLAGAGAGYNMYNGDNGLNGGAMGGGIGLGLETAAMMVGPKLLTSPSILRMLATNPSIDQLPLKLRALASANPKLAPELTSLQNYMVNEQNSKEQDAPHFLGGGYAGWPEQTNGFALGGLTDNPKKIPNEYGMGGYIQDGQPALALSDGGTIPDDSFKQSPLLRDNTNKSHEEEDEGPFSIEGNIGKNENNLTATYRKDIKFSKGGIANNFINRADPISQSKENDPLAIKDTSKALRANTMYAQGGIAHNTHDPRPFYNPQLPNVAGAGWQEGGPVSGYEIGEYSDGGSIQPNWEVQNNNFAGMRIPGVNAGPNSGGFQSFSNPEDGLMKLKWQLERYASGETTGKPLNTLNGIISTWAPPKENDTKSLIERASKVMGVKPTQQLNLSDPSVMAKTMEAMIRGEQGGKLPVDQELINKVAQSPTTNPQRTTGTSNGPVPSQANEGPTPFDDTDIESEEPDKEDDPDTDPVIQTLLDVPWVNEATKLAIRVGAR